MPSKEERELLFNHALEADDIDYARKIATPNGYRITFDEDGWPHTEPVFLSDEELAAMRERDRRRRRLNNHAIDPHLDRRFPGGLGCEDKRSMDFYE